MTVGGGLQGVAVREGVGRSSREAWGTLPGRGVEDYNAGRSNIT